jgi:hypothetical protein
MSARSAVLFAAALVLAACQSAPVADDDSMCQKRKPGTIVTVNEYCVMVPVDPVDPSIVIEWNGQKVGLCCKGCIPKWEKLSETDRAAALRAAIAKGPIAD